VATLTIRDLSDELVTRLREAASRYGRSPEEEVRLLLHAHYAEKSEILRRVRTHWDDAVAPTADEAQHWRQTGRE